MSNLTGNRAGSVTVAKLCDCSLALNLTAPADLELFLRNWTEEQLRVYLLCQRSIKSLHSVWKLVAGKLRSDVFWYLSKLHITMRNASTWLLSRIRHYWLCLLSTFSHQLPRLLTINAVCTVWDRTQLFKAFVGQFVKIKWVFTVWASGARPRGPGTNIRRRHLALGAEITRYDHNREEDGGQ